MTTEYTPQSATINELQDEVIEQFADFDDWMDKYQLLIDLGNDLAALDEKYKNEQNLIDGCQSRVWIQCDHVDGRLYFTADSDALIVKGIIALLIHVISGHTPQEIIESVDYGIFAPNFGGGQVDITSGKFVFSTSEAYLIEKGKVTKAVKGATLIGSGIEAMQQISMVGNDLKLDNGVGVCGKEGQSLPVGVGQPTLKVDNLTVGGTA